MSDMNDINTVASLITIAKTVKDAGYSPYYIKQIVRIADEEELFSLLESLELVFCQKNRDWSDVEKTTTHWFWSGSEN